MIGLIPRLKPLAQDYNPYGHDLTSATTWPPGSLICPLIFATLNLTNLRLLSEPLCQGD
jgi:hypothetical protein